VLGVEEFVLIGASEGTDTEPYGRRHSDDAHDPRRGERRRPRLQAEILSERPVAESTQIVAPCCSAARGTWRGSGMGRGTHVGSVDCAYVDAAGGPLTASPCEKTGQRAQARRETGTAEPRGADYGAYQFRRKSTQTGAHPPSITQRRGERETTSHRHALHGCSATPSS
jgi:hypothetical protein